MSFKISNKKLFVGLVFGLGLCMVFLGGGDRQGGAS